MQGQSKSTSSHWYYFECITANFDQIRLQFFSFHISRDYNFDHFSFHISGESHFDHFFHFIFQGILILTIFFSFHISGDYNFDHFFIPYFRGLSDMQCRRVFFRHMSVAVIETRKTLHQWQYVRGYLWSGVLSTKTWNNTTHGKKVGSVLGVCHFSTE